MDEFVPLDHFNRIMKFWWLLALITIVGGLCGYIFSRSHPSQYEAVASFFVTIDSTKMPELPNDRYQYDEDISLAVTSAVLQSPEVLQATLAAAAAQGISLDEYTFRVQRSIERRHAFWEIHYRSLDPANAQMIVNLWAEAGYQTMLAWQKNNQIVNYVSFAAPTLSILPRKPVIYDRNKVMLAGSLIGFVIGIFVIETLTSRTRVGGTA